MGAEGPPAGGKRSMLAWVLDSSRSFYEAGGGTLLGSQKIEELGGVALEEAA